MLGLLAPTDPSWVSAVEGQLERLLSDHAHCELKAAHSALSLIGRYGFEHPALVAPLSALAHEETSHFEEVNQHIETRGYRLSPPASDDYVVSLQAIAKATRRGEPALLDRLAIAALIEARSCERFRLLSEKLNDSALRTFYRELMVSEAKHFRLFAGLAEDLFGTNEARSRIASLARQEAEVAMKLPLGPKVHG